MTNESGVADHGRTTATFELYEVERGYPEMLVAEVSGSRLEALREIMHYAMMYGQDGPVSVREVPAPITGE